MGKSFFILLLLSVFCASARTEPVFLFDGEHQDSIALAEGAKIENGVLKLDGKKGFAEFRNSAGFDFSANGMTLVGEVKLFEEPKTGNGISRDMILTAWFFSASKTKKCSASASRHQHSR